MSKTTDKTINPDIVEDLIRLRDELWNDGVLENNVYAREIFFKINSCLYIYRL